MSGIIFVLSFLVVLKITALYKSSISHKVYYSELERKLQLEFLATVAKSDETLAYIFRESKDPALRDMANSLMETAILAKKTIQENSSGIQRKYYLEKAEGTYTPKAAK